MPRLSEETVGTGDQSWLGSTHGLHNARSVAPDPEAFPTDDYPNGVPAGTPLAVVDELAVPYNAAGNDGSEVHAGFLVTDQKAASDGSWPLLDHGRVKVDKLPVEFDPTGEGFETTGVFVFLNTEVGS